MLAAQVWSLGLGATDACAAPAGTAPGSAGSANTGAVGGSSTARSADAGTADGDPDLLGDAGRVLGGTTVRGAVSDTAAVPGAVNGLAGTLHHGAVAQVLHERLGTDELPLPGQRADVPDAFAIATGLLPSVPPQAARPGEPARASRSHPSAGRGEPEHLVPTQRGGPTLEPTGFARTGPDAAAVRPATVRDSLPDGYPAPAPPLTDADPDDALVTLTAAPARADSGDTALAVLIPIAAGMLLTGAAMYKHRGLPGGH